MRLTAWVLGAVLAVTGGAVLWKVATPSRQVRTDGLVAVVSASTRDDVVGP